MTGRKRNAALGKDQGGARRNRRADSNASELARVEDEIQRVRDDPTLGPIRLREAIATLIRKRAALEGAR